MIIIIDVAILGDGRVGEKEDEKVEKYQDLARAVRKMWDVRTKVDSVVMGALGTVPVGLMLYKEQRKLSKKMPLNRRIRKEPRLKFHLALALIDLRTTRS